MKARHLAAVALAMAVASPALAKVNPPSGILAASVGDQVVLVDASGAGIVQLESGPVGWLYPAPGGILFAPDVINGSTSVVNLRTQKVVDRLDGLTMPLFSIRPDRYIALPGDVLVMSYPARAMLARIEAEIVHPWQAVFAPKDTALLILERLPDNSTGTHLTTVNLLTQQTVFRKPLGGDIRHMAISAAFGLVAFADAQTGVVHLVQPATLNPQAVRRTPGTPVDVVFARGGKTLVSAAASPEGSGVLDLAVFKGGKKGLRIDKEAAVALDGVPVRLALSPDGEHVAVAMEGGAVAVVRVGKAEVVGTHQLPGTARDLRWCDPGAEGPIQHEWSNGTPDENGYDPYVPKVTDGSADDPSKP